MADDTTTKAPPTLAELEGKVQRLTNQVSADTKLAEKADSAFASAVKNGNVDDALKLADERTTAKATLAKSQSQLKTATGAIESAKHAANADKIAAVHDDVRDGKLTVPEAFAKLQQFGVKRLVVEMSDETGKLIITSAGPKAPKRSGGGGGGGNGRGQPLTVDGKVFDSANAALMEHYPDFTGKMGRSAIVARLVNAGHEVS